MISRRSAATCLITVIWLLVSASRVSVGTTVSNAQTQFDVNDLSYLWPVPSTAAEVAQLVSADELSSAGTAQIWPRPIFDLVLETALAIRVDQGLGQSAITFGQFDSEFRDPKNWKVVAFRADPSAPGGHSGMVKMFGSTPQLRVILQPVTLRGGTVEVHDVTAHLAFSFVKDTQAPAPGFPREPDRMLFTSVLDDLKALKASAEAAGVPTRGPLQVHPALEAGVPGFVDSVRAFLKRHMTEAKLTELAFMGVDQPEPWIFFGMAKSGGTFVTTKPKALGGTANAQMLILRGGPPVLPPPKPTNLSATTGVSTSLLFEDPTLDGRVFPGRARPLVRDVPDLIANPERSHVLNTDCVSCHTESAGRSTLNITSDGAFRYKLPAGISGVDPAHLPQSDWNVRNFGWFSDSFQGGQAVPTISMRTANEAAEAAEFVNREYFMAAANGVDPATGDGDGETPRAVGTAGQTSTSRETKPQPVASPLTLVMNIKSKEDYVALKSRIEQLQSLPPDKNPIVVALNKIGTVHFARFVFLNEQQLAVITTYDGSFDRYIDAFVNAIGKLFDEILVHMSDAPPLPVSEHRKEFLEYVRKHDLPPVPPFYSAYPTLRVLDIIHLQNSKKKGG